MAIQGVFEKDTDVDRNLLIWDYNTPHCKVHNAMLLLNEIWRCYGTYKGNSNGVYPAGMKPIKFIERTCNCAISDKEWGKFIKLKEIKEKHSGGKK